MIFYFDDDDELLKMLSNCFLNCFFVSSIICSRCLWGATLHVRGISASIEPASSTVWRTVPCHQLISHLSFLTTKFAFIFYLTTKDECWSPRPGGYHVLTAPRKVPGSNPHCRQFSVFHENHCNTQFWAWSAHSAYHPFWVGKWVVIHVITWITGVKIIKRQTKAAYGCLVAGQSSVVSGLDYSL